MLTPATGALAPGVSWEGRSPDYPAKREWAEHVERYERAEAGAKVGLLKQAAASRSPLVSEWAIRTLAEDAPQEATAFLEGLSRTDLTLRGLLAVERVLAGLRGGRWVGSPGRKELLARLAAQIRKGGRTRRTSHSSASGSRRPRKSPPGRRPTRWKPL